MRVVADDDFRKLPVIDMQGNSKIEVSFDYMGDEQPWLLYRLVHCDAQWEEDDLSELDYMEGFLPVRMDDLCQPSFNTLTTGYYHFSVCFPNEEVRPTVSGNYAVLISSDEDPDAVLAVATFSVCEQQAFVRGEVSGNTDIDFRKEHQQVSLSVSWSSQQLPHLNPLQELNVQVRQNRNPATLRLLRQPMRIESHALYYEHCPQLIFEGGNTWRQFENIDERYPGIRVDRVRFTPQGYDAWLYGDQSRAHREYLTDPDIHGRYKVHAVKVDDPDTEGEYSHVHFSLKASPALDEQGIFLFGDFTYGQFTESYRMDYLPDEELYVKDVFLKQGAYNYQYVTPRFGCSVIEGNHYETPNEYDVFIYYRPFGARYDRLIGVGIVQ